MNSGEQTTNDPEVAYHILAYLHANPDAQDTVEGIVEWWLLDQKIRQQTERVKQALTELTARGFVVAKTSTDSRVLYGIDRSRQEEIESFLKNWPK